MISIQAGMYITKEIMWFVFYDKKQTCKLFDSYK